MVKHAIMRRVRKVKRRRVTQTGKPLVGETKIDKIGYTSKLVEDLMRANKIGAQEAAKIIMERHHDISKIDSDLLGQISRGRNRIGRR